MEFWSVTNETEFHALALERFRFQAEACRPYRDYLGLLGYAPERISAIERVEQIPFLPIELFKSHEIYCRDVAPEAVFTSSGDISSRHMMSSLANYERAFIDSFERLYGSIQGWSIYALLPSYLEREGSSLIYMVDKMLERARGGGFYLYDHEGVMRDMSADSGRKILLGVSYALLDLSQSAKSTPELLARAMDGAIVMETGGMKGRRAELSKAALHSILSYELGVAECDIHSEYGMAELTSQGYSRGGNLFETPPWMRCYVRDVSDPFALLDHGVRGGINIVDLASVDSCSFIETQDMGRCFSDGRFSVEGRITGSDIRGCNLLIE